MNLSVPPDIDEICKVLKNVRELLKDHVLPRLNQLEEEVRLLRKVTWPVCQSLQESSQLADMDRKRAFLQILDPDEVRMLLDEKATISQKPLEWSSAHLLESHMSFTSS